MQVRLQNERPESTFFVFADTIAAVNYTRTIKGDGWLGVRFQLDPGGEPNDIVLHVKMLDRDNQLQQQAIGILGVNLIYACYRYNNKPEVMLQSLMDSLHGRVKIDMIRITGPDFEELDNRLLALYLVKHKLTDVAMFGPDGKNIHASEFLYRKHVMMVRGSFRPATLVNLDMLRSSFNHFRNEEDVEANRSYLLTEITLGNLTSDGELDEADFLDRADLLNELGQTVVISNCEEYSKMNKYLSDFKIQKLGIVIGVRELLELISEKFYQNMDGQLLSAFGELFSRNVKLYVYPALQEGSEELITAENVPIPEGVKFLYRHLLDSGQIVDVQGFNADILHIFSKQVLDMLRTGDDDWEVMVPSKVASLIKQKCLFGYPSERMEFEY